MRLPGGAGCAGGLGGLGFAAGREAGRAAFPGARRTGAFRAGRFPAPAVFLRAAGRPAGAFLRLAFAFFLAAICILPAGPRLVSKGTNREILVHPHAGIKYIIHRAMSEWRPR